MPNVPGTDPDGGRYRCFCPNENEPAVAGRVYTDSDAECAEIAAARYALFFAKRFLATDYMPATPRVLLVRVLEGRTSRDVTVGVQPSKASLWGWRAVSIEGAAT